jgi:hypothetical protein
MKRFVAQQQHRRVSRQASNSQQRPLLESVLLRRLYFLDPERSKYACLGFYPDSVHQLF